MIQKYEDLVLAECKQQATPRFVQNAQANKTITLSDMRWFGAMFDHKEKTRVNVATWTKAKTQAQFLHAIIYYHAQMQHQLSSLELEVQDLRQDIRAQENSGLNEYHELFKKVNGAAQALDPDVSHKHGIPACYAGEDIHDNWGTLKQRNDRLETLDTAPLAALQMWVLPRAEIHGLSIKLWLD